MTSLLRVASGEIDRIKAHLAAGGEVVIPTYTRCTYLDHRHMDYIRADGDGYRLGWPGHKSVYVFAANVALVPLGETMRPPRRRR